MNKFEEESINSIEKFAELGKMSYGLFHDILNPISGISMYVEKFGDKNTKIVTRPLISIGKDIKYFMKVIGESIETPKKSHQKSLNSIINMVVRLMKYKAIKSGVNFYIKTTGSKVYTKKVLDVYRLIINTVSNSLEAFDGIERKNKFIKIFLNSNLKNTTIRIEDNGKGIHPKHKNDIFKLFFSTKKSGSGIGLSVTKKIVYENFGGKIRLKTKYKSGTKFEIDIPTKNLK